VRGINRQTEEWNGFIIQKRWSDKATPSSLNYEKEQEEPKSSEGLASVRGECCLKEACSETGSNENGSDYHEEVLNVCGELSLGQVLTCSPKTPQLSTTN